MTNDANILELKALQAKITELKKALPTKIQPQYLKDKREVIQTINNDLIQFNKVHKVVTAYLKNCDKDCFQNLLSDKQKKTFNAAQYEELKLSFKLVMKVTSTFVEMDRPYSTSKYLNLIIKGSCLTLTTFKARKSAKVVIPAK